MTGTRAAPSEDTTALRASGLGRWSFTPGSYSVTIDEVTARLINAASAGTFAVEDLMASVHAEDRAAVFTALEAVSRQCQTAVAEAREAGIRVADPASVGLDGVRVLEEFRVRDGDAGVRWLRLRGGVVPDGTGGIRITGVTADTTALRASRDRTGRTLAQVSEGVLILEPDWTVGYHNAAAATLLRRPGEDLAGRDFWTEFPHQQDSPLHVNFRWAMEHQRPVTFETPTAWSGWLEMRAFPSLDGLTVYLRSVEDRHFAERERGRIVDRLEGALARGRQLLALTRSLAPALTVAEVADAVTANARRSLGTVFAGIALVDGSRRYMEYVSMSPLPAQTAAVWSRFPLDRPAPVSDAARLGRPFFHENVEQAVADFPDIGPHMLTAGTPALAHLPLFNAAGTVLGTLALSWGTDHAMPSEDRDFLVTVAGHTAQALERALLYEQQQTVADALQRAVLPDALPVVPGLSIGARFVPAAGGLSVGGDWYDAFELPYGRLAVAVGDAAGHGLAAARVMSGLRNALRAYAMLGGGPGSALTWLDRLVAALDPEAFATVAYFELDPATGDVTWASAGHPPPLVAGPDGARFLAEEPDPPLGAIGAAGATRQRLRLEPGETLLLFSDGLVERRDTDLAVGLDRLRRIVGEVVATGGPDGYGAGGPVAPEGAETDGPAERVVAAVSTRMLSASRQSDDVCLLAVRLAGPAERAAAGPAGVIGPAGVTGPRAPGVGDAAGTSGDVRAAVGASGDAATRVPSAGPDGRLDPAASRRSVRRVLRPLPSAAFDARTAAREALREWHLEELTDTLTLVVSELVTNAVTHAGGPMVLELELLDDAVRVGVADSSTAQPEHRRARPADEHGRGIHLVDVLAARWGTDDVNGGKRVWAELDLP